VSPAPKGRGADWTEERGTSDEGRRHLKGAPEAQGKQGFRVSSIGYEAAVQVAHEVLETAATIRSIVVARGYLSCTIW
jgi:hypothetical protein